jgi:hypothetical protein
VLTKSAKVWIREHASAEIGAALEISTTASFLKIVTPFSMLTLELLSNRFEQLASAAQQKTAATKL